MLQQRYTHYQNLVLPSCSSQIPDLLRRRPLPLLPRPPLPLHHRRKKHLLQNLLPQLQCLLLHHHHRKTLLLIHFIIIWVIMSVWNMVIQCWQDQNFGFALLALKWIVNLVKYRRRKDVVSTLPVESGIPFTDSTCEWQLWYCIVSFPATQVK